MDTRQLAITVLLLAHVALIRSVKAERNDSIAMLKLASTLHRVPKSWSGETGSNYCNWEGVKCDRFSNRVTAIYLSNRNLSGTLPPELSSLSQLQYFSVAKNRLSGPVPSFANLSSLQKLYLGDNEFTSIPPGFFRGLASLQVFSINNNWELQSWVLTDDLARCTSLEVFEASDANVSGIIPDIFSSLRKLQDLDLSYNFLTGTLPPSLANSTIQDLSLSNGYDSEDRLSGSIDLLASMTQLRQVYLSHHSFTGQIPNFSNCKNLFSLDLSDNSLTGLVPASLVSHPTLTNVTLATNYLQGPFPQFASNKEVKLFNNKFCKDTVGALCDPVVTTFLNIASALQYPVQLAKYWRGDDACSFENFVTCDAHHKVIIVNLACQNLSGTISQDFSNLTHLRSLMLNDNNLTGPVPEDLTKLSNLKMVDISNNNLSGTLPNFSSLVRVYATGNPFLIMPYSFEIQPKSSQGKKRGYIIAGVIVAGFVSVMVFALFIYKFKKRITKLKEMEYFCRGDGVLSHIQSRDNGQGRNVVISIKFLRQVTDNFNEANILGRGGSGVVYKGELDDGTCIAVKRMKGAKEMKDFLAEMKVLTRVRHRRLVALLGYCINRNEKILVYEYMQNGTLRQHLFEWHERGFLPLTWVQRVTIAIDVARGVEYLHILAQETFIHRDLKPSNILLGEDMRAKVADFGLVKKTSDGRYSTETKVAGTFGYLAPEYAATGKVTTKVDVYAFGVILMEMITGRKAVHETVSDEGWMCMHLVTWFRSLMIKKEDISAVIDNTINLDDETLLSVTKVAELAGHCTSSKPHQRPDMSHVVNTLGCLVEQWTPPSPQDQANHFFDGKIVQLDLQFLQNMQVDEDDLTTCDSISCS